MHPQSLCFALLYKISHLSRFEFSLRAKVQSYSGLDEWFKERSNPMECAHNRLCAWCVKRGMARVGRHSWDATCLFSVAHLLSKTSGGSPEGWATFLGGAESEVERGAKKKKWEGRMSKRLLEYITTLSAEKVRLAVWRSRQEIRSHKLFCHNISDQN